MVQMYMYNVMERRRPRPEAIPLEYIQSQRWLERDAFVLDYGWRWLKFRLGPSDELILTLKFSA